MKHMPKKPRKKQKKADTTTTRQYSAKMRLLKEIESADAVVAVDPDITPALLSIITKQKLGLGRHSKIKRSVAVYIPDAKGFKRDVLKAKAFAVARIYEKEYHHMIDGDIDTFVASLVTLVNDKAYTKLRAADGSITLLIDKY